MPVHEVCSRVDRGRHVHVYDDKVIVSGLCAGKLSSWKLGRGLADAIYGTDVLKLFFLGEVTTIILCYYLFVWTKTIEREGEGERVYVLFFAHRDSVFVTGGGSGHTIAQCAIEDFVRVGKRLFLDIVIRQRLIELFLRPGIGKPLFVVIVNRPLLLLLLLLLRPGIGTREEAQRRKNVQGHFAGHTVAR